MSLMWNILSTLVARLVVLGLALASSILLARLLGPEGRGLFALVLLLPELASKFALLGFEQANAVYAGLKPEGRRALVWQSAAVAGAVGGGVAVAGIGYILLGAPGFQALARGPLWLYVLPLAILPVQLVAEYWWAILRGMNRIALLNVVEVVRKISALALVVVLVGWWQLAVAGAVLAHVLIIVGVVGLLIALLTRVGIWGKPSFDRGLWRHTGRFAFPAYCNSMLGYLNYRVDQFIIAILLGPEPLAFYVIAVDIAERLWFLTGAVANALLPHLTNARERDPALPAVIARHVMFWTGVACLLVFVLADPIVQALYSSAFAAVTAPLRWILPGIFVFTLGKVLLAEILVREKVSSMVWMSAIGTVVNVIGNLLLIPHMGISGAALASSISYSLISAIVVWYYLRETGVPWTTLLLRRSDVRPYVTVWRRYTPAASGGIKG
jgi:O-antigen/teichoic acid export membrane protein